MLNKALITALFAAVQLALAMPAVAETAPVAVSAPAAKYSTADTTIGDIIDNPATRAILDKHIPGFSTNEQVGMARGMTLRAIQPMVSDQIKAETLDAIDADFAKL